MSNLSENDVSQLNTDLLDSNNFIDIDSIKPELINPVEESDKTQVIDQQNITTNFIDEDDDIIEINNQQIPYQNLDSINQESKEEKSEEFIEITTFEYINGRGQHVTKKYPKNN
jgi:hypothetical protein